MQIFIRRTFTLLLFSFFLTEVSSAQPPTNIPQLRITDNNKEKQLTISKLNIDITVVGNIATTTFDITFYNPFNRVLEGEFDFPLADGQNIASYALDINGILRQGVVVEKAKARIAFENTVRRQIDPGLVEKTRGNHFRTRIYPIPANGYKRVVIGLEQTLGYLNLDRYYQLPLSAADPIDEFSAKLTVIKSSSVPIPEKNEAVNFEFSKWNEAYIASVSKTKFTPAGKIAFTIPAVSASDYNVFTENRGDQTYFYLNTRTTAQTQAKQKPRSIGLLWDVSASAAGRDIQKEIQLIESYMRWVGNVSVDIIPFHINTQPKEHFNISKGDATALVNRLRSYYYDGGTQLGVIDMDKLKYDEIILCSDGISTFGSNDMRLSSTPVMVISSSQGADYGYLKHIAAQTRGLYADLNLVSTDKALDMITHENLQLVSVAGGNNSKEIVTPAINTVGNDFSVAGIFTGKETTITLNFGFGNRIMSSKTFIIQQKEKNEYDHVKRIWASMKIARLEMQYEQNKETITRLGKDFSIVTPNTSLLVLDRVEDYVQYEIVPPAELQAEYTVLMKQKREEKSDKKATALQEALDAMEELKSWWNKKFDIDPVYKKRKTRFTPPDVVAVERNREDMQGFEAMTDSVVLGNQLYASPRFGSESKLAANGDINDKPEAEKDAPDNPTENSIEVSGWKADAPYLDEMGETAAKNWESKYLLLKKEYATQPSFFVDMAMFFMEKKRNALALRVLSNIAEMKLESPELLRIMGYYLLDNAETQLAIATFKEVLKIREEEPQAYRDLALAYNKAGLYQQAVDMLYRLLMGNWDDRFGEVKGIALNEMNAIISARGSAVKTRAIDKRLIYAMPVDVRIVVSWSANDSDVDLWVTDPHQEKCFYSNALTHIGGRISKDVTQGYGPEEFELKRAANGSYKIEVNYFGDSRQGIGGPVTVRAELFTDFGKPSQKQQTINVRLTSGSEVIRIGKLKFGLK
jgi:tetratricopeptide (TPR) repeat protein